MRLASSTVFQSTLSVRRATISITAPDGAHVISIHALREESDPSNFSDGGKDYFISIHALREESDTLV